jgi:hypothetical protein
MSNLSGKKRAIEEEGHSLSAIFEALPGMRSRY